MPRAGHVRHQLALQRQAAEATDLPRAASANDCERVRTPPFGSGAMRFDVRGNVHPQNRTPGTYTEAVYEPSAPHQTGWNDGPGQYSSHEKLHPSRDPLLGAFREVGLKSDREKYVLKPTLLKDFRKSIQQDQALRGPGHYQTQKQGPAADVAQVLKNRLDTLHGSASPLSVVRSRSATAEPTSTCGSSKAFPQPVSLKRMGLTQQEAQVLRAAAFKKKCGWSLESQNRDLYRVHGARHSFVPLGDAPAPSAKDQKGSVDQPTRGGQGPGHHPRQAFTEEGGHTFNHKHSLFENTLKGRDSASIFARRQGDIAIGEAATSTDPNIGPGYVDPVPFTAEPAIRQMQQFKCTSLEEVDDKKRLLNTRMKMSKEVVENHRRKQKEDHQWKMETHERRERMKWTESQGSLRKDRVKAKAKAGRRNGKLNSQYDSEQRSACLKSPARDGNRINSRAFQVNIKAVSATDDNYVRLLNEREPKK